MILPTLRRHRYEITDEEGACLAGLARQVPAGQCIVEIGSFRGRSMAFLATGSHYGKRVPVYCIDLWLEARKLVGKRKGARFPAIYDPKTRARFDARAEAYGHGLVTPIMGDSPVVAQMWTQPVGLLFVDGAHDYDAVKADLTAWLPHCTATATIAFHDWPKESVQRAAYEAIPATMDSLTGRIAVFHWSPIA